MYRFPSNAEIELAIQRAHAMRAEYLRSLLRSVRTRVASVLHPGAPASAKA